MVVDSKAIGQMRWFRCRIRSGTWLALFALAFQMAISLGHIHRDDLGLPPLPSGDEIQSIAAVAQSTAGRTDQGHSPDQDDYCPICASMMLVATAIPSVPPVLTEPAPASYVWPARRQDYGLTPKLALSFRARGPPTI